MCHHHSAHRVKAEGMKSERASMDLVDLAVLAISAGIAFMTNLIKNTGVFNNNVNGSPLETVEDIETLKMKLRMTIPSSFQVPPPPG